MTGCPNCRALGGQLELLKAIQKRDEEENITLRNRLRSLDQHPTRVPRETIHQARGVDPAACNWAEDQVRGRLHEEGYTLLSKGYPDFLAFDMDDEGFVREVVAVEVKMPPDRLRPEQEIMLAVLRAVGVRTRVEWVDNPKRKRKRKRSE